MRIGYNVPVVDQLEEVGGITLETTPQLWTKTEGAAHAAPEQVGFDSGQLGKLDAHYAELIAQGLLQGGGHLVARNGKIASWSAMGRLNGVKGEGSLQPDSIRKLSSLTKAFTTIALVKLIEDGKLDLDQPVAALLEEFDNGTYRDVTLFHLLTHTSGIPPVPGYYNEPYPRRWYDPDSHKSWIVQALTGLPVCKPGEAYNYTSTGYALLGEIVSRVSGERFEEYVMNRIVHPLGLERTWFDVPAELHAEVCVLDQYDIDSLGQSADNWKVIPRAASGMHSTMYDLWKLGQMLLNGGTFEGRRILGRKSVELLTKRHLFRVPAYHWGGQIKDKGHALGFDLAIHSTSYESQGTYQLEGAGRIALFVDPAESMVVVLLVPSVHSWVPRSVLGTKQIIWSSLV